MDQPSPDLLSLQFEPISENYLREAARWGKFLSIVGFIFSGITVIAGLFAGTMMTMMSSIIPMQMGGMGNGMISYGGGLGVSMFLFYAAISLLYFFPSLFLFRFSTKLKLAFAAGDQFVMNDSLKNLKSYFKFVGILTLIGICFFALFFLIGIIVVISMSGR